MSNNEPTAVAVDAAESQPFRVCVPMEKPPASVAELASFLLVGFEDGNANAWRPGCAPDPYLPRVTKVDSVHVFTSAEGLEGDLADQVAQILSSDHFDAVVVIKGMAIPPTQAWAAA